MAEWLRGNGLECRLANPGLGLTDYRYTRTPWCGLRGCKNKRRLNQALSVLSLSLGFLLMDLLCC